MIEKYFFKTNERNFISMQLAWSISLILRQKSKKTLNITANISVCVYVIFAKNKDNWIHVSQTLSIKIISFFPSSRQFMLSSMSRWRWDLVPPLLNHKTTVSCRFWKPPHWRLSGRFRSSTTVKSWLLKSTQKVL